MRLRRRLRVWHCLAGCLTALRSGTWAACLDPSRPWAARNPSQTLQDFSKGSQTPSPLGQGKVWGEGKQSWHKTTPRRSILASCLHRAELLLDKTNCHSLTCCWGIVTLRNPLFWWGEPHTPFSSCLHTSIPIYQAGPLLFSPVCSPRLCGYIHCNHCKPRQALEEQASEAGRGAQCCRDSPELPSQQATAQPQITGMWRCSWPALTALPAPPWHPVPPESPSPFLWIGALSPPLPCSPSSCGLQRCIVGNSQVFFPSLPPLCARSSSQGVTRAASQRTEGKGCCFPLCTLAPRGGGEGAELLGVPSYRRRDVQHSYSG